jgi:inosose dehydratase
MSIPARNLRLGAAPELWLGGEPSIPRPPDGWLAQARGAGYEGVELEPVLPDDPRALATMLDDRGLAAVAIPFVGGLLELTLDEEKRRLGSALELLARTGCRLLAYTDHTRSVRADETTALADRHKLRRDDARRYGEKLTRLADWLAAEGAALAWQPRLGTILADAAEIDLLLESSDVTVGLVLDMGVLAFAGADPLAAIRRHRGRLRHVRLQAVREVLAERVRAERWSFPRLVREGVLAAPGDEEAASPDLAAIGATLAEAGYAGWLVAAAERALAGRDPRADAEAGIEALRQVARAAATSSETKGAGP